MSLADEVEDKVQDALNAEGRSASHVALGALLCLGAVAATAVIASVKPQPVAPGAPREPRSSLSRAIWPALFSVTTLAALRLWNAPPSPARTRALGLWGALQGLNAVWMLIAPRDKPRQIAAGLSTAALTLLYARTASEVDERAANLVGPAGWASLAGLFAKKQPYAETLH
jgi:tryptophan-rich sensory protein